MKAHFTHGHYATPMVEISLRIRVCRRCLLFPAELASSKVGGDAATAIPFSSEKGPHTRVLFRRWFRWWRR